jgi:prepilin-type N-terminal cleavage/methylation domain-containing protein
MLLYNARRKVNQGFTLIEMMVVVIIIGVIASIAAPNFLGLLNQSRVKDALAQVEGAIKESQRQAIRQGKTCKIRFTSSGTGDNRSIVQVRPDETFTLSGGTTKIVKYTGCLLNNRELPNSVSLSLLNSGSGTLETIDSTNEIDLAFSTKGNPDVQGIMVIEHPGTNTKKCIQIAGLLGNMITGDYDQTTKKCKVQ